MSVDLKRLPADEEMLRTQGASTQARTIQNVLDALNWFRCKAKFAEQELARLREPEERDDKADRGDWEFHQDHDQ